LNLESGNLNQKVQKPTPIMTSPTKKPETFFSLQTRRLAECFEGLDSSLAQSTGELWSCKVARI